MEARKLGARSREDRGEVAFEVLLGLVLQLVVHFLLAALVLEWGRGPGYG